MAGRGQRMSGNTTVDRHGYPWVTNSSTPTCIYITCKAIVTPSFALRCAASITSITAVASSHLTANSDPVRIALPKFRNKSAYAPASLDAHLHPG